MLIYKIFRAPEWAAYQADEMDQAAEELRTAGA